MSLQKYYCEFWHLSGLNLYWNTYKLKEICEHVETSKQLHRFLSRGLKKSNRVVNLNESYLFTGYDVYNENSYVYEIFSFIET